jgi:phosphatidylinositol kinase/protein kinase (PI-3  family)
MLVNAFEVCGIEGIFKHTCEDCMTVCSRQHSVSSSAHGVVSCVSCVQVMRREKDSLMAMLEAFVHDPLIRCRSACVGPT